MIIEKVLRDGVWLDICVDGRWHRFHPDATAEQIKAHCAQPSTNTENFNKLKALEGIDLDG